MLSHLLSCALIAFLVLFAVVRDIRIRRQPVPVPVRRPDRDPRRN
ncbi:MAG TPA: hypothetical protein VL200_06370 [Lacunisphaera sp.]|jgi:hypothetical protein|nr:hypothetical protein [Lacunisphaera sp.]